MCVIKYIYIYITTPKYRIFPEELSLILFFFFLLVGITQNKVYYIFILNGAYINPHTTLQIKTNEKRKRKRKTWQT